jgi:hypothetical protein
MKRRRIDVPGFVLLIFIVISFSWGCTSARSRTGSVPDVHLLDSVFHSGVSTKGDVEALLGKPNGYGGAMLPTGQIPHDVWFYHLIEASVETSGSVYPMEMEMDFLLIFFEAEVYDGHMWFKDFTTGIFRTR